MSDSIISCVKISGGEAKDRYEIVFEVSHGDEKTKFCVSVFCEEMQDFSNINEMKEIALKKAEKIKAEWIEWLDKKKLIKISPVSSLIGNVELSNSITK